MLSLKENTNEDNEILKQKLFQWSNIPKYSLKPDNTFFLNGNLFIDLNPNPEPHLSNINYYKQISSSTILKDIGIIYRNFQTNTSHFDSSKELVQVLRNVENEDLRELGVKLTGSDERHKVDHMIKHQMKQIAAQNTQVRAMIAQQRQEFEEIRKAKILEMPKDKFIMFVDLAFDYTDMCTKITGEGMNEGLIKLLGCDLDSMQTLSIRKGILNFVEESSLWKMINHVFQSFVNRTIEIPNHSKLDIKLFTLDDITIDAKFSIYSFFCKSGLAFQGYFHPEYTGSTYDRRTFFCEFDISDSQINKLNAIRQDNFDAGQALDCLGQLQKAPCLIDQGKQLESQQKISSFTSEKEKISEEMDVEFSPGDMEMTPRTPLVALNSSKMLDNLMNDIPYVVQSQYFIEKFYGKKIAKKIQIKKDNNEPYRKCGFKLL